MSICVRQRSKNGAKIYQYEKRYKLEGERIGELRVITAKEFIEYQRSKDETIPELHKTRIKFIKDTQPFTLETIDNLRGKPSFLRLETLLEEVRLPDDIEIIKDVTHDPQYSSYEIAKRGGIPDY
jgi:hypothetical protein